MSEAGKKKRFARELKRCALDHIAGRLLGWKGQQTDCLDTVDDEGNSTGTVIGWRSIHSTHTHGLSVGKLLLTG